MAKYANSHEVVDWHLDPTSGRVDVTVRSPTWEPSLDGEDGLYRFGLRSVGVVIVVHHNQQRFLLLVQQSDQENNPWGIPAGIAEPGETPGMVATREALEETGLVVPESDLIYLGTSQSRLPGYGGIIFGFQGHSLPPTNLVSVNNTGLIYFASPNPREVAQLCLVPEYLVYSPQNPAFIKPYVSPRATLEAIGLVGKGAFLQGGWPRLDPGLDWPY